MAPAFKHSLLRRTSQRTRTASRLKCAHRPPKVRTVRRKRIGYLARRSVAMRQSEAGRMDGTRSGRGSLVLVMGLVLALIAAASSFLYLPEQAASLVVLACLGILSTIG